MQENGAFQPAQEYREEGDDQYRDNKARDDKTVWLDPTDKSNESSRPNIGQLLKMLQQKLLQDLSQIIHLHGNVEYQLAYYHPQNARYERHRDAFPTSEQDDTTQRRVTAIVYLNPDWVPGDGGELRLFGKNSAPDQDVEPVASRMVVFLSGVVDHAVISASKSRYALTAWIR
jgi:Rps23 Pro-64 3,4-dihydroxylase Tpa1-like proline 4-hydroxylase